MRSPIRLSSLLVLAVILAACAAAAPSLRPIEEVPYSVAAPEMGVADAVSANRAVDASGFASSGEPAADRLVIETGSLTLVVKDPAASVAAIQAMAEGMGGFVVSSNVYQTSYGDPAVLTTQASITIRVPADQFREALRRMKDDAEEVRAENESGQDVTQQYTDLQSRLRNLEAAEEQLRGILTSATKTEDVLQIFQTLRQVREEIEVTKGQIQYFEESAAFSAISVELIPDVAAQPLQIGGWKPEGTAKLAIEALVRALQTVADGVIWLVIFALPIVALIALPVWAVVRVARRRRAALAAAPPTPEKK